MYSERGDTRNPITLATSSGLSMRPKGICLMRRRVNSSGDWLSSAACSRATDVHMSVSTNPGHTQFTRIPSAACAIARLLVKIDMFCCFLVHWLQCFVFFFLLAVQENDHLTNNNVILLTCVIINTWR